MRKNIRPSHIACNLLQDLNASFPVNLEQICIVFGIELKPLEIDGEAFLLCKNGKTKILYNVKEKNAQRLRFSIAHELGHYFIPWQEKLLYFCDESDMSNSCLIEDEKEANEFAGELLVPRKFLIENRIYECTSETIKNVSRIMNVSLSCAAIKLINEVDKETALVFSKNGYIEWTYSGMNFDGYIRKGSLNKGTLAAKIFDEENYINMAGTVKSSSWIDNEIDTMLTEEVIPMKNLKATLSILKYKID